MVNELLMLLKNFEVVKNTIVAVNIWKIKVSPIIDNKYCNLMQVLKITLQMMFSYFGIKFVTGMHL